MDLTAHFTYKKGLNGAQEPALFRRHTCLLVIYTTKTLFFPVPGWIHCTRKWDGLWKDECTSSSLFLQAVNWRYFPPLSSQKGNAELINSRCRMILRSA